jgi:hypothetical protein
MSKILLIVLFALCSLHAWPQAISYSQVKGRIADQETEQPLADATVVLLRAKDSSHAATAFTDKNGAFILEAVPSGRYQLYITYLGYRQQLKAITVTDTLLDLGSIALQKSGVTLGMVEIVEVRAPMVVKKDTLEFNADYYRPRENAVMEELLRKLPGVEMAADGTIKVNGETVKKILVDGKPFFGDDPKLATRNLPADMIDKVQLIDRKSDQAQFNGANDGKTEKAINITVKKEKRDKLLGRMSVGYGTDKRFAVNGNLNRFGQDQLSVIGSGNNINGYQENGTQIGGSGIIRNWNMGANYSTDLGDAIKISGSYYFNNIKSDNERASTRQNVLPDTTYYYNQDIHSRNTNYRHTSDMRVEYRPDTLHTVIISTNINYSRNNDFQENIYTSLDGQHQVSNNGNVLNADIASSPDISANFFFGKRFKKAGRTFSFNFLKGYSNNKQQQLNRSHSLFIQPGGEVLSDTLDQRSNIGNRGKMTALNLTYTEPLYKDHFLDAAYSYNRNFSSADKLTYDYNAAKGIYDRPNDSLSNNFENSFTLQQGSLSFRTQKQKYDYSLGVMVQVSALNNKNISGNSRLKKQVTGFFPAAFLNYAFDNNHRLRFQYNGNIQQPDVSLLQPVLNNSNPLYIQLGNPNLKPAVIHSVNIGYNSYNPQTFNGMSLSVYGGLIRNKVIITNRLDTLGRQTSQPQNTDGVYNMGINITNAFPLKNIHSVINTHTTVSYDHDVNLINSQKGTIKLLHVSHSMNFTYNYEQLFDFVFRAGVNYSGAWYSQQQGESFNLYNYTASFNGNISLPQGFILGTNINYQHNAGEAAGYSRDVIMINAYIGKKILQGKKGLIKIQGFDLLKQNQGFIRTLGANYIEDTETRVLQRFFMVSFIYFLKS